MNESIHDYEGRFRSALNRLNEDGSISGKNRKLILRFKDECFAGGLSTGRVTKYIYHLMKLCRWLKKDFEEATREDLKNLVIKIERCQLAGYTKMELATCIKKLFKMMRGTEEYPPEVKWIKPNRRNLERIKLPEEILTEDDVIRLINAARSPRDRAFVSMLYESGCRIGEILFIRNKHVQFDQYGAVVRVSGKTGPRRIRIVSSVPYIMEWLNHHPFKESPDAFLWICKGKEAMTYGAVRTVLDALGERAGIKKKLNPHNFRHSRATYLANHLTESQLKDYLGWIQASKMAAVYVHLSGRDVDNAILKVYGITNNNEKEEPKLNPKTCPRCKLTNQATNLFCSRCGMPLDRETVMKIVETDSERKEADRILDEMIKDEEFREVFLRKARELMIQSKF